MNIATNNNVSKNIACIPKKIGDLAEISSAMGKSIPDAIIDILVSTVAGKSIMPLLIILYMPLTKKSLEENTRIDLFLVKTEVKAIDIRHKYNILTDENFKKWFYDVPIDIIFTIGPMTRHDNAFFNGKKTLYKKVVIVGAGTLGSNILDYFIREGVSEEILILDFDCLLPHNICRHVLMPDVVMHSKALAMKKSYNYILDQKIKAINSDILQLSQHDKERIYSETDLLIDVSTSVAVERNIAFESYNELCRRCTVFLNPKGNELVLFLEDKDRKQRLDLLEMSYQRNLIINPKLDSHLDVGDQKRTNNFNCRSISSILDYDNVGILAAIASQQIKKTTQTDNCCLCVWNVDNQDGTVSKVLLSISEWELYDLGDIHVYLSKDVLGEIEEYKMQSSDKEIGGCLFGCYDKDRRIIYILYIHPAPCDSECNPASFIRGYEGLLQVRDNILKKTYNQVVYLGEWHSHPNSSKTPSSIDKKQFLDMSELLEQEDLPFVQVISGKNGVYINAKM